MSVLEFFVSGFPRPKGSMRAFVVKGRAVLTSANPELKTWHQSVDAAMRAEGYGSRSTLSGPVRVQLNFYLQKPKKPKHAKHITKPDIDKLVRATLDPLTGVLFHDDSQVMALWATKEYAGEQGCGARVRVETV